MRQYHHYGIPTVEKRDDESYVEVGDFKFYVTPYEGNKWKIQWQRYPEGHGLPDLLTKVPHIAFQVDDLDKEIEGCKVILGPYSPIEGFRVAIIEDQWVPIELVETTLSDDEVSSKEKKRLRNLSRFSSDIVAVSVALTSCFEW